MHHKNFIDIDSNEFDNFISKKKMGGFMKGLTSQLGACIKEISETNPKFKNVKDLSNKGMSETDKQEYQSLMKDCMEGKKHKAPPRPETPITTTDEVDSAPTAPAAKKNNMQTYLIVGAILIVGFIIYKRI